MIKVLSLTGATVGDDVINEILVNYVRSLDTKVDLTIFGGGGLLWRDMHPPLLQAARDAVASGKPVIGIGLGVQGISDREKWSFLKGFKRITVRDPHSREILKWLLGVEAIYTQDVGWLAEVPKGKAEGDTLGVLFPDIMNYPLVLRGLQQLEGFKIRYIPFHPTALPHYQRASQIVRGEVVPYRSTRTLQELWGCRLILSAHLHGLIFSVLAQVPCIVVPWRDKVRWMCQQIGYERFCALTDDEIVIKAKNIMQSEAHVRERMGQIASRERLKAEENLKVIRSMVHV